MWEKKTDSIKQNYYKKHTDEVTAIIPMPKLQFVASASLDSKIILWNTIFGQDEEKKVRRVYENHKRGVVSLAFNEALILLLSAGIDHSIFVFNPYINTSIYQIQKHAYPLVGI